MEASTGQIHHHGLGFRSLSSDRIRFKCKPLVGSIFYGRCRTLPRLSVSMQFEGSNMANPSSETKNTLRYTENEQNQHIEGATKSYPTEDQTDGNVRMDGLSPAESVIPQKRAAKIHDFCFGIPFGGLVLSGGLVGFLFSRNPVTLTTGVLYGGALLALSFWSLKIWRKGKSSLPFILGQAALSAVLLAKHFQMYSSTKKLFPSGFYAVVSAAMLCFYSYVMASGGNPPPKKLKLATSSSEH